MKIFLKALSAVLISAVLLGCFVFTASAKDAVIMDGLVAYYDGANNSNGRQDLEATVWRDLSGNGYHFNVETDGETKWTDMAFHSNCKRIYFNEGVIPVVNAKQYTIDMVFGEMEFYGTDWLTLVASDNDEFSMFIRVQDGLDQLEYKYNDNNRDRPIHDNGKDLVNNSTLTVTFDIEEPICKIYIDGELVCSGVPAECNIADTLFFGHENSKRSWQGDIYAFRFYDRVLSEDEIKHNCQVDNDKYRSGNPYTPEVVDTNDVEVTTREEVEYNIGDVIMIADFSDPATFEKMIKAEPVRCSLELSDIGAVKVTVDEADPYFYIPIDSSNSFDGDKFTTLIITYKTEGEFLDEVGEIYFSTKYSEVYFTDNRVDLFLEESAEFKDLEVDMRENDNDTWHNEIRMIRIDPTATGVGQVYYIKSVQARYEDPNKPVDTEPSVDSQTDTTAAVTGGSDTTADVVTTDKAPETMVDGGEKKGSNTGLIIGIIAGVAVIGGVVAAVVISKKKKK